jgi:cysteinyl-tRNA synthetase
VHGEHLIFDGRKMAKSTGNLVRLSDVTDAGLDPLAVRLALLEQCYRHQMNLTWDGLRAADLTLRRWRSRVAAWSESPSAPMATSYVERVEAAFDDDLDTPAALRVLLDLEGDESVAPGGSAAELLQQRSRAREAEDWPTADRLRDELGALGVRVTDAPEGQSWF